MRYFASLFIVSCALYGAQPNMHTALTLTALAQREEVSTPYRIDSCTFTTMPSEHCIRTTGGSLLSAAFIVSLFYGYPIQYPGDVFICTSACAGTCLLGSAKMLANKKCTVWYCCPRCDNATSVRQSLPEVPTIPEPITIELELPASAPQADGA